jgi:hypothetical protein
MPALVRSISRSRSNSATAAITPIVILPGRRHKIDTAKRHAMDANPRVIEQLEGCAHVHHIAPWTVQFRYDQHVSAFKPV